MKNYFNVLQDDDDDEFVMVEKDGATEVKPTNATEELEDGEIVDEQVVPTNSNATHKRHIQSSNEQELEDGEIVESHTEKSKLKKSLNSNNKQPQYTIDLQFDFNDQQFSDLDQSKSFDETWVLWYDNTKKAKSQPASTATPNNATPDENSLYLQNLKRVGTFDNIQTLVQLWSTLTSPMDTNISIFKDGIEPAWESTKNKDGGKYSVNYIIKDNIEYAKVLNGWFTLVTSIVFASQWENYSQTNGIVISFRSWGASISLWNSDSENQEKVNSLRDALQSLLKVKYAKYQSHNNTILLKTFKKNDEKKKKMNYKFQKTNTNGGQNGFDNYQFNNNNNNNNNNSWSDSTNDNDGINVFSSAFSKGYSNNIYNPNNPNNNTNNTGDRQWTSQLRKIKPLTLGSYQDDKKFQQPQQQQPVTVVAAPSVVSSEPAVPVPEIPAGMNAWATGILLGKDPIPLQTPFVAKAEQVEEKDEDAKPAAETVVEEEKKVEKQPAAANVPVIPSSVNAWSTGLLLPKSNVAPSSAPVVEQTTTTEPVAVVEQPTKVVKEEKKKETVQQPSQSSVNAWATGLLLPKSEKPVVEEKVVEEKPVVVEKTEKKVSEKKEKKTEKPVTEKKEKKPLKTSSEDKETSFWEAPKEQESKPVVSNAAAPVPEQSRERKRQPKQASPVVTAPVSLWEQKDNVIKLMETIATEDYTITMISSSSTTVVSNATTDVKEEPRVTLQIKAQDKKAKVKELQTVTVTEEWTSVEEKKPKKSKEDNQENNNNSNTSNNKTKNYSNNNQKEEKTSLIHALSVEEPIEYKTPIKPSKPSNNNTTSQSVNQTNVSNSNNNKKEKSTNNNKENKTKVSKPTTAATTTSTNVNKQAVNKKSSSSSMDIKLVGFGAVFIVLLIGLLFRYLF